MNGTRYNRSDRLAEIRAEGRRYRALRHGFKAAEVMEIVKDSHAKGYSYGMIAWKLNDEGYVSPHGEKFHPQTIKRLLEDPIDG